MQGKEGGVFYESMIDEPILENLDGSWVSRMLRKLMLSTAEGWNLH